jgi:hypothetical protein
MLINAKCNDTTNMFCYAHGEYLNEDGISADLNNTLCEYDMSFETYADSSSMI